MNKEMLYIVQALSNEKGVEEEHIFQAIQSALASVAAKKYAFPVNIRVAIDRQTGEYEAFRYWNVVADSDEELEFPEQDTPVSQAKTVSSDLDVGDVIEERIDPPEFGRIAAQQAKQVIVQKVREAERHKIINQYRSRIGELLHGVVKKVTRDYVVLDMGINTEALLPREHMIPREAFRINDRIRVVLADVREGQRGPQLMVSRSSPLLLIALFKIEVPEINEEVIEIKRAARDPSLRAKIAVKTNDGRIDPIGACVGMRGARVQAVSNELGGERIDIILWDDNPAQLVINAMAPAEVTSILVDEDKHSMDVIVSEQQLSQAIGRNGQNIRLASELTGWTLNVMADAEAQAKHETETHNIKKIFVDKLGVDEEIANILIAEGFTNLEELAYIPLEELESIEDFDHEMATELQQRASDVLLTEEIATETVLSETEPAEDLLALDGMTRELAAQLASQGILTREDLAEQSVDDLTDIIEIDPDWAAQLIMKAREHWFAE